MEKQTIKQKIKGWFLGNTIDLLKIKQMEAKGIIALF